MNAAPSLVSLLPSATEIVYALGLEDRLLGVTDECPVPPGRHPVVVRARQPVGLTAGEIDAWVRAHAADGLYDLDDDLLARLAPDVVLTQDLCRVCALPGDRVDAALVRVGGPATVVTLVPTTLADVLASIEQVAAAAGAPERGAALVGALHARLAAVAAAVSREPPVRTLVLEWLDPPFTAGHWVPDVVTAAGGVALLGVPGGRSTPTSWDRVVASDPELVVLSPCGTSAANAWAQAALLPDTLRARPLAVVDLARPGPVLVDAVEALAAVLHPAAGLQVRPDIAVPRPIVDTLSDPAGTLHP